MEAWVAFFGHGQRFQLATLVSACWGGCFVFGTERDARGPSLLTGQMQCSGECTECRRMPILGEISQVFGF